MSSVDPWEKATECARAVKTVTDPQRRAILSNLQDLWVALANESSVKFMANGAISEPNIPISKGYLECD